MQMMLSYIEGINMKSRIRIQWLAIFIGFMLWISIYYVIDSPLLVPSIQNIGLAFVQIFTSKNSLEAIFLTIVRLVIILFISSLCGVLMGAIASKKTKIAYFLQPYVTIFRTIPVISIFVILIILFGFNSTPLIVTSLMIFPIIYQQTLESIRQIDQAYLDIYHLEDNRFWSGLKNCYLPLTKNQLLTAFLQSAGLGIKVLVMSEYLAQTPKSIGFSLYLAKTNIRYDQVFAWTILLIIIAILIETWIRKQQLK